MKSLFDACWGWVKPWPHWSAALVDAFSGGRGSLCSTIVRRLIRSLRIALNRGKRQGFVLGSWKNDTRRCSWVVIASAFSRPINSRCSPALRHADGRLRTARAGSRSCWSKGRANLRSEIVLARAEEHLRRCARHILLLVTIIFSAPLPNRDDSHWYSSHLFSTGCNKNWPEPERHQNPSQPGHRRLKDHYLVDLDLALIGLRTLSIKTKRRCYLVFGQLRSFAVFFLAPHGPNSEDRRASPAGQTAPEFSGGIAADRFSAHAGGLSAPTSAGRPTHADPFSGRNRCFAPPRKISTPPRQ